MKEDQSRDGERYAGGPAMGEIEKGVRYGGRKKRGGIVNDVSR
jgi:hypothetical protein